MHNTFGVVLAALLAMTGGAAAKASPDSAGPPIDLPLDQDLTSASLTATPNNEDLQREYPAVPLMMRLGGTSSMTCKVSTTGSLMDCHVVSEEPAGLGFGVAEIRTAVYFHVTPATKDGLPVEGRITIPIRWQTPGSVSPPPTPVLAPVSAVDLALGRQVLELEGVAARMQVQWLQMLDQQTAQTLAHNNSPEKAHAMLDAFHGGLTDTVNAEVEEQAHTLAAHMSEADLRSTIAFLRSSHGRAWTAAQASGGAMTPPDFGQRLVVFARARYCPGGTCP